MNVTSREFRRDIGKAKKAAANGPVFITDQGRAAHVLLTMEMYQVMRDAFHPRPKRNSESKPCA